MKFEYASGFDHLKSNKNDHYFDVGRITTGSGLPTEKELQEWIFQSSVGKSTNKLVIDDTIIQIVESDCHAYKTVMNTIDSIQKYEYRVKSPDSIKLKVSRHPELRFQSVFNDILGIRVYSDRYLTEIPKYYRVVDLINGKKIDDGYRAQHLYYKYDNLHYIIEVQVWAGSDIMFNTWSHALTYKVLDDASIMRELRELYDCGKILSGDIFEREALRLWNL